MIVIWNDHVWLKKKNITQHPNPIANVEGFEVLSVAMI